MRVPRMRRRTLAGGALAVVASLALAGCQSVPDGAIEAAAYTDATLQDPVEPVGPGGSLTVEAFEWGFNVEGAAIDGPVEIVFENIGGSEHNFRIDTAAGENKKVEATGGESAEGVLKLFGPGEYTYYRDVPGHRGNGMVGTLRVFATPEEADEAGGQSALDETAP